MVTLSFFYSVYDKLSCNYGPIQEFSNQAVAIRAMKKSFNSKDFEKDWSRDFTLYCLGCRCVDDKDKQFLDLYDDPIKVCDCSDLIDDILEEKG